MAGPQPAQGLEPVDARHHHVEEHGVEAAADRAQPGLAAGSLLQRHALRLEVAAQQLAEAQVVVDE